MKRMNRTSEDSFVNIIHEGDNPSEHMDPGVSSPRRNELISNNLWPNASVSSAGKTCDTGPENGRLVDCISHEPEEFTSHLAHVEAECGDSNEEPLPDNIERDPEVNKNQDSSMGEAFVSDVLKFKKCNTAEELSYIKGSEYGKLAHFEYITGKNTDNVMTPVCTYLHPMTEQCPTNAATWDLKATSSGQHSCFKLVEAKNGLSEKCTVITSQPSDEQMQCNFPVCLKEITSLIESPLSRNRMSLNVRKGKERVLNDGGKRSVSTEKDDSRESAESSNSKEPCPQGKRTWGYGQEAFTGTKRMRKSIDKYSCSGSHVREDGSFMNWISSVTKGLFGSEHAESHSLGFIPRSVPKTPSNCFSSTRINDSDRNAAFTGMGFGSIFKALYCPWLGKPMKTLTSDHEEEYTDFKRLPLSDGQAGSVKAAPVSSMRNVQGIGQFREPPLAVPSISPRNSPVQEKVKHKVEYYCNLCNVGLSSSSFQNGSSSHSEGKEVGKLGIFEPNNFLNLPIMNKTGSFPACLWITRFSPKHAALTPCEKVTDDGPKFLHYSQNENFSVWDCSNSENVHMSTEDQSPYTCEHVHGYSTSPMGSCGSKKVYTDLKTKFKLNPILPSQTFKKLEPMTSVLAKRLDAFRHIRTPEVQDDATPETATCFFCGKNGHSIMECSNVDESELEDLMQKMNSYGRVEKLSCICIRCFPHDHWTVACPNASLHHHHIDGNTCNINDKTFCGKIKGHRGDTYFIRDYDVGKCSKGDHGQSQFHSAHEIPCQELSGSLTEVQTSNNMDILDIINMHRGVLSSYLLKDAYRKTEAKGKQIASTSTEIKSISKPLMQTMDVNNKHDRRCLLFERIRKLRLSRTEIIRWMESPVSHFSIVGFFLRVRVRKWEEDLGGTGYHVACISGACGQKMYGYSKSHLPVDIGGLRCLVDCHFISNHDFVEDELKAWWLTTLRRGSQLPSEEDLDKKLEEREKFDLYNK